MRLHCSPHVKFLSLLEAIRIDEPLVIDVEVATDRRDIELEVSEGAHFKIIGAHQKTVRDAFAMPFYAKKFSQIPSGAFFLLTYDHWGYTSYFCLTHTRWSCSLEPRQDGIFLKIETYDEGRGKKAALVVVRGSAVDHVLQQTMQTALLEVGESGRLAIHKNPLPEWIYGLGWSSRLGYASQVTHEAIIASVQSLLKRGILLQYVNIAYPWKPEADFFHDFEADADRFPQGIKGVVRDLQALGIQHVGAVHSMPCGRKGIAPELAQKYRLTKDENGYYVIGQELGSTFHFFHDFYAYLRRSGLQFITLCAENAILDDMRLKNIHNAVQAAASLHFSLPPFHDESIFPANLFRWSTSAVTSVAPPLVWKQAGAVLRGVRDRMMNLLWIQYLMEPDSGGWMSFGPLADMLAMLHAFLGGLSKVGDPCDSRHNEATIQKLVFPNGFILQPDKALTPCVDSLFVDPLEEKGIYKAYSRKAEHYFLLAFNYSPEKECTALLSGSDIEIMPEGRYAVFSYRKGFLGIFAKKEQFSVLLKTQQSDVMTFAPLHKGVAVWGCFRFFLASGPIEDVQVGEEGMSLSCMIGAEMLLYCEHSILDVRRNGRVIPWEYDSRRKTLKMDSKQNQVGHHCHYVITFES